MKCEKKDQVLEYLKGDVQDPEIEAHLEVCDQCQALVEGFLAGEEAIRLPEAECSGGNLKEQVEHYDKGTRRIVVFTVVGLILGWFSYKYYITDFLPLKIILGIPYKISEIIHVTFHNHGFAYSAQGFGYSTLTPSASLNEFFPQSYFASAAAEFGIAALVGGAVYGSIGFFTGDKRIFTLTKYLKFAAVWAVVISLAVGGTFLVNHLAVEKNQKFEDVSGFFLHYEFGGEGYYGDDIGERGAYFKLLSAAFLADGPVADREISGAELQRNPEQEETIEFVFGPWHSRYMAALINLEDRYLVSDAGEMYRMSEVFCRMVKEYREREEREHEEAYGENTD